MLSQLGNSPLSAAQNLVVDEGSELIITVNAVPPNLTVVIPVANYGSSLNSNWASNFAATKVLFADSPLNANYYAVTEKRKKKCLH